MSTTAADLSDLAFGRVLRETRGARKLSQLDLARAAEISQRHLSFLESGRARPSRAMVLQLAESLDLPLRSRNRMLVAAGFAPVFPQRSLDSPDMAPVRQALERMLQHHEPFPALVMDRAWNILMANRAMERLFAMLGDPAALWRRVCGEGPRIMYKLTFHPEGLRPLISNMDEVGPALLARAGWRRWKNPRWPSCSTCSCPIRASRRDGSWPRSAPPRRRPWWPGSKSATCARASSPCSAPSARPRT